MKIFTLKQVLILVFVIIAGIAFVETSSSVFSSAFWREFLLNLLIYGAVSEFIVIALGAWIERKK